FTGTGGEIAPTVRSILTSPEFAASAGGRLKRPFEFVASALRAVGADTHAHEALNGTLGRMGQAPFQHPTPDGYADEATPWLGTLLWRWNVAFALASGEIAGTSASLDELAGALGLEGRADPARVFEHAV